jgi:CRISPR-associated endonuclease/helicase Cas3
MLLSLSATGRATEATFQLTPADEAHEVVRRRLDARKSVVVRKAIDPDASALAEVLAEEAWKLTANGTSLVRCMVFCNSRKDAQKVREELTAKSKKAQRTIDCDLFVGGRRVHEREAAARWLAERGFLAGQTGKPSAATFLVATSAAEVGVDLDADHAVSDIVAWERMVQRFGRVNRRGDGDASVVLVPAQPTKKERQVLDIAPEDRKPEERSIVARLAMTEACLRAIQSLPRVNDALDASPGALLNLKRRAAEDGSLRELLAAASTPAPLHPALSRALVESWSMTSLEHHSGRPEVEPWIRGWVDSDPQTVILWRNHLPVNEGGHPLGTTEVEAYFEAAPPHLLEQLETESYNALDWLLARLDSLLPQSERGTDEAKREQDNATPPLSRDRIVGFIQAPDGKHTPLWGDLLDRHLRGPKAARDQLDRDLRGSTLILDARLGGLTDGLLASETDTPAEDVGDPRADLPFRIRPSTAVHSEDQGWFEELRLVTGATAEGEATRWLVIERPKRRVANTEEGRSTSWPQSLSEHQSWAEREAVTMATRLGLPAPFDRVLAIAARLHDEGKRAARWQRAFNAPKDGVYAKTVSRPNIALLDGYRHELGSVPYAAMAPEFQGLEPPLRDLCFHLIAAHHGFARPLIRTDGCEDAPPSALTARAQEVAFRFSNLEERWGPWGLAWWEALLRAADQEASRKNDDRAGGDHG